MRLESRKIADDGMMQSPYIRQEQSTLGPIDAVCAMMRCSLAPVRSRRCPVLLTVENINKLDTCRPALSSSGTRSGKF